MTRRLRSVEDLVAGRAQNEETATLAARLAGSNVTANCLHPGLIATGIGQTNPVARLGWKLAVPTCCAAG